MRINAYILIADSAWIEASVLSYYDNVGKIIVSYDENRKGWTGAPIPVDECLDRLRAIDREHKLVFVPGHYARLEHHPMENETYQRQCAFDLAAEGADWVLQLDTDEVIPNWEVFLASLEEAHKTGYSVLEYPSRWLYKEVGSGVFLELRGRLWSERACYPGPAALKCGVRITHARRTNGLCFHVGYDQSSAASQLPDDGAIQHVIASKDGLLHFSWVRDESQMRSKLASWGHAKDRDWSSEVQRWEWAGRHPYLAVILSPFARGRAFQYLALYKPPRSLLSVLGIPRNN